jgi:hypothetical protein
MDGFEPAEQFSPMRILGGLNLYAAFLASGLQQVVSREIMSADDLIILQRCNRPTAISRGPKCDRLDQPTAGGSLRYLQRCGPERDTDATWQNSFEQAGDASSCSWPIVELQAVSSELAHF